MHYKGYRKFLLTVDQRMYIMAYTTSTNVTPKVELTQYTLNLTISM